MTMTRSQAPTKPKPTRIRITEETALILTDLVDREIRRCLTSRAEMREAFPDVDTATQIYNARLHGLRELDSEIEATGIEEGWWEEGPQ